MFKHQVSKTEARTMYARLTVCTVTVVFLSAIGNVVDAGPRHGLSAPGARAKAGPDADLRSEGLPRVAVLDFIPGDKITPKEAAVLSDLVRDEMYKSGKDQYEILDRKFIKDRLAEKDLRSLNEFENPEGMSACGKSLGVDKIVGGNVSAFGELWMLAVQIVDVGTGEVVGTSKRKAGLMSDLLDAAPDAARELLGFVVRADEVVRSERERLEKERREALDKLWDEQKEAIIVKFKKAPPSVEGAEGIEYRVSVENPTDQPATDVRLELRGLKKNQVYKIRFKEIAAHGEVYRTIRWEWPDKALRCVVTSVGGEYDNTPKAKSCSKCKGVGTTLCRSCMGQGYKDCRKCKGNGFVVDMYYVNNGTFRIPREQKLTCPACHGSGRDPCPVCHQSGRLSCQKCRSHKGDSAKDNSRLMADR